ncbi:MAG TPA: hypothetical protein VM262_11765 [Acidimicrobiales bacterium]|jgi:hypothetical protein|nr:hypothetical protein [Acidimicrobiales bacterium]
MTVTILVAVVASVVLDALLDDVRIWGVAEDRVVGVGPGVELAVTYPAVARPGLAAPLRLEVVRDGGFTADIELAVPTSYLRIWDENGLYPTPKEWRSEGDRVVLVFDPPRGGKRFTFFYDARIEPAVQRGRDGYVAVLEGGEPAVIVRFRTRVLP